MIGLGILMTEIGSSKLLADMKLLAAKARGDAANIANNVNSKQGFSGFLSDVGDVQDMSKNLVYIFSENRLDAFKKNALVQAKAFTIAKVLPMYEDIYTKLVR